VKPINDVYIAATATLTAPSYSAQELVDIYYPNEQVPRKAYKMARILEKQVGIQNRSMVTDPTIFPEKRLCSMEHTAKNWGMSLLDKVADPLDPANIGFISVAYNVTSHQEKLPNLACQIAMDANLALDEMPSELAYYGCAAGIFAIREAIQYCQRSQKAAFVYVFDQCNWIANPIHDAENTNFKAALRSHLLFSDGAVGILVIPESMRNQYSQPLIKILGSNQKFQLGNIITMENSVFLVGNKVAETMPALVADQSIKPLLEENSISPEQVAEWSIHQGGIPVLEAFKEERILGLSEQQLQRSQNLFRRYGNFSAPSCLYVLDSFFQASRCQDRWESSHAYGVVTGFGAGYYFGSLLYQWD
jgi:predicted naringenin-chalcone synthase